jgi:phenylalanyl-tRNA synthetase beta chain
LSYSLAKFEGISNRVSPLGIQILLERSGHSTHDAVIDMTNYLMTELGQPMHAFDADTIAGHVIVRQAIAGESIVALDGKTYVLTPEDIVIADTEKLLAIA